jgi:hypothetical protein
VDITDGESELEISLPAGGVAIVEIRGYKGALLAASTRISL